MSRIGKKLITLPEKTEVTLVDSLLTVKGPKGTLSKSIPSDLALSVEGKEIKLVPKTEVLSNESSWGTFGSHLINMVEGVTKGFEKKLIIEGIGYKAEVKGTTLALSLGFSHPVNMPIPEGLKVTSDKGIVTISGVSKDVLGQFAASIRELKKPEPYKGKGIRYDTEVVKRKQGKKTV